MTRLGAIFGGGQARRFGADKAAAKIDGVPMIDRIAATLRLECDMVVVVGREWPGLMSVSDLPEPGLGPLGALAGALGFAAAAGFRDVLTSGCDLPDLPPDLSVLLSPGPSVVAGQPLIGLWPAGLAAALGEHLRDDPDRSMRAWIAKCGARRVRYAAPIANINTQADLAAFRAGRMAIE